jgi:hypothetical protein
MRTLPLLGLSKPSYMPMAMVLPELLDPRPYTCLGSKLRKSRVEVAT